MFNVRYKLRESTELVIPKGPDFFWARKISCNISDNRISFKAPRHRPRYSNHDQLLPARWYEMDEMRFSSNYSKDFKVSDNWDVFELFHRTWAFNGPWFTGTLAELEMYFKLVKPVNFTNMNFSLFHPRAFEKIVGDYLTNEFSSYIDKDKGGKHHYIAPVHWQPLTTLPVVAVRLQVMSDESVARDTIRHFVFFPIADQVMACIQFIPSQLRAASQEELDKRVSRSTMYKLMNNIIDSIQLELSPEAIERQKIALEGLEDTSLVKDYPPLKWNRAAPKEEAKKLEQ